MFSPAIYQDLVAQYSIQIWPLQLTFPLLVISLLGTKILSRTVGLKRYAFHLCLAHLALIALCLWLIGWQFFIEAYAVINWAAKGFAIIFMVQSAIVSAYAMSIFIRLRTSNSRGVHSSFNNAFATPLSPSPLLLLAIALVAYPAVEAFQFRNLAQLSIAGADPDTTMILHIAAILALGLPRWLVLLPSSWLAVTALTHMAIGNAVYFLDISALLLLMGVVATFTYHYAVSRIR